MKQSFIHLTLITMAIVALTALSAPAPAMAQGLGYTVGGFIDEDGDGYNDLAPDADGDGIPNGQDPDYTPPLDGTGERFGALGGSECLAAPTNAGAFQHMFMNKFLNMWQRMFGQTTITTTGYGPGDGTGNDGVGPGDGTGYGRLGGLRQRGQQ